MKYYTIPVKSYIINTFELFDRPALMSTHLPALISPFSCYVNYVIFSGKDVKLTGAIESNLLKINKPSNRRFRVYTNNIKNEKVNYEFIHGCKRTSDTDGLCFLE
jgi:hypothetical protein